MQHTNIKSGFGVIASIVIGVGSIGGLASSAMGALGSIDILSLDATRSARPFATSGGYSVARNFLSNPTNFGPGGIHTQSVTIHPPVSSLSASALSLMDIVVITEQDTAFSGEELNLLQGFVLGGGSLLVAVDTDTPLAHTNALLALLGGTSISSSLAAGNGPDVLSIINTGSGARGVQGPFGVPGPLAATLALTVVPGSGFVATGVDELLAPLPTPPAPVMGEVLAGALGAGSGSVLIMSDPLFLNVSTDIDQDNLAYLGNWVVPAPGSAAFLGLVLIGASRRRRG